MDFAILASGQSIAGLIYDLAGIIIINLVLAGHNAVVIAMAAHRCCLFSGSSNRSTFRFDSPAK